MKTAEKRKLANIEKVAVKINPFLIKDENNGLKVFESTKDSYKYVITLLVRCCLKGYIELLYALTELYPHKGIKELRYIADFMEKMGCPYIAQFAWGDYECRDYLYIFCRSLVEYNGLKLDINAFETAYFDSKSTFNYLRARLIEGF